MDARVYRAFDDPFNAEKGLTAARAYARSAASGLFLTVPNDPTLLDAIQGFHGDDPFAGACFGSIRLSDTIDATVK